MRRKTYLMVVFLAAPIFIRLTSFGSSHYKTILFALFAFFLVAILIGGMKKVSLSDPLLQFNLLFFSLTTVQFLVEGNYSATMDSYMSYVSPFIASTLIVVYLATTDGWYSSRLTERVFNWVAVLFVIQFLLSLREMTTGQPLIDYDFLHTHTLAENTATYESRSLLAQMGLIGNFGFPMTMLLGQWNFAAPLLAIYNLIFLVMYQLNRKRVFLVLATATLLASFLNTTRVGIITLIVTDILYYINFYTKRRTTKYILIGVIGVLFCLVAFQIAAWAQNYFVTTNTISGRLLSYGAFVDYIKSNLAQSVFGFGFLLASALGAKLRSGVGLTGGSFESQFLSVLFTNGLLGLWLLARFLIKVYKAHGLSNDQSRILMRFLVLNVALTSITMIGVLLIYTYPFMTLLYTYIRRGLPHEAT